MVAGRETPGEDREPSPVGLALDALLPVLTVGLTGFGVYIAPGLWRALNDPGVGVYRWVVAIGVSALVAAFAGLWFRVIRGLMRRRRA